MDRFDTSARVVNLRVTHKRAPVHVLEAMRFDDPVRAVKEMRSLPSVSECVVLQTCNRVEVFAFASENVPEAVDGMKRLWLSSDGRRRASEGVLELSTGSEAIGHLLRVAAGLESMVVGEDEVLGQVKTAFEEGMSAAKVGPVLEMVFQSALRVGKAVRAGAGSNRGSVSVGSAGVARLRRSLGELGRNKVLVEGAGEAGETVARALAARGSGVVFIANRTYQKAVELAKEFGGRALPFDALERRLTAVDALVVATSAPHYIITYAMMTRVMAARRRKPLMVVDLGEPRNVEVRVARIPGLTLRDLDDLRGVMRSGIERRSREVRRAERLVEQGLGQVLLALRQDRVEPLVSILFRNAEAIRKAEVEKALARMRPGTGQPHTAVMEDLSKVLVKRILFGPVNQMRESAASGELESLDAAEKLFTAVPAHGHQHHPAARPGPHHP